MFNKGLISVCIVITTLLAFIVAWTLSSEMISSKNSMEVVVGFGLLISTIAITAFIFNSVRIYLVSAYKKIEKKKK